MLAYCSCATYGQNHICSFILVSLLCIKKVWNHFLNTNYLYFDWIYDTDFYTFKSFIGKSKNIQAIFSTLSDLFVNMKIRKVHQILLNNYPLYKGNVDYIKIRKLYDI